MYTRLRIQNCIVLLDVKLFNNIIYYNIGVYIYIYIHISHNIIVLKIQHI